MEHISRNISNLTVLLVHFEAIYRYCGLRAASEKTGIPLCRLSKSLNDLEQIVHKKLFYSDKNRFEPTRDGTSLYREIDESSILMNLSSKLTKYINNDTIRACLLPQIKNNITGNIISKIYIKKDKNDKNISLSITCEHFNEDEMLSRLRAYDLDIVLSYFKLNYNSIKNKVLYIDKYSFLKINNNQNINKTPEYLVMLDMGNLDYSNKIKKLITDGKNNKFSYLTDIQDMVLPDIESIIELSSHMPIIVFVNNSSLRRLIQSKVKFDVINDLENIEIPVYMSYHKMNPYRDTIDLVYNAYLDIINSNNE